MRAADSDGVIPILSADTNAPVLPLPSSSMTEATNSSGMAVSYTASASDVVDGTVTPVCTPASGSTFPIATTTVSCTATDSEGNVARGSFTITVTQPTSGRVRKRGDRIQWTRGAPSWSPPRARTRKALLSPTPGTWITTARSRHRARVPPSLPRVSMVPQAARSRHG